MSPEEPSLEALLERGGVAPALRARLAAYGERLLAANRRMNLTGAKTGEQLSGHILDSLSVLPYVREPYVDVGSGGGLPAIPVAMALGIAVTVIEATAKKAHFLETMLEAFEVPGRVVIERAETAAHRAELRESFGSGTARALGGAAAVAELLLPFLEVDGLAILQRGTLSPEEQIAVEDAALVLGGRVEGVVPLDGNRRLVLLRKTAPTPRRFPRRAGIPAKRPLCS